MTRTMIVLPCPGSSGVEQWIENPRVGGSIPPPGTTTLSKANPVKPGDGKPADESRLHHQKRNGR